MPEHWECTVLDILCAYCTIELMSIVQGHTMPSERRAELIALCVEYECLLVADEVSLNDRDYVIHEPQAHDM